MDERIHHGTGASQFPGTTSPAAREGRRRAPVRDPVVPAGQGIGPSRARRLLDVAVAVAILVLVFPLFLVLAVATRLSTGGTAIYRQPRVGQGGIPFLYLVRTAQPKPAAGQPEFAGAAALVRPTDD